MNRRTFLKQTGITASIVAGQRLGAAEAQVSIVLDKSDAIAGASSVSWAAGELQKQITAKGNSARIVGALNEAAASDRVIVAAGENDAIVRNILTGANVPAPSGPEALCLVPGKVEGRSLLLATGSDARALVYALLELADRVEYGEVLNVPAVISEKPANVVRSCARCFVSDVEDKSWFYDRAMWEEYLSMLATNRFNRFNLTLGIGYNAGRNIPKIPDAYFYLAYPFLLDVPGYQVKAVGLDDKERDKNLETLQFIGEQTVARGLQFNLALWSHAYVWEGPSNYTISGLTNETHAKYCRDGLAAVLKACPSITGLSFRVHGESGIPDGRYEFWETLFEAIAKCGRHLDVDVHAKGTNPRHIDIALRTGASVSMAPKFWAEHCGMPYHQAAIREVEWSDDPATDRRFLRYGYGDYLREDRKYGIIHRIWPGTQRHLLWGDPAMAAGYGRAFSFCGSLGYEVCEPLSFKGRMGSGLPGGRNAFADKTLESKYDWEKFRYQYRLWGRLTYNPDTPAEVWRRQLRHEFKRAAQPMEIGLAHASRVTPVITTAHDPSASNNSFWPEMYLNMPMVDPKSSEPYRDTPTPHKFGTVSPLDPQLFTTIEECVDDLLAGRSAKKYTSCEVAAWLSGMADAARRNLKQMISSALDRSAPSLRRAAIDIEIQSGVGLFFARKIQSALYWAIYEKTGDRAALQEAIKSYRQARDAWAGMADSAKKVYASNITYGPNPPMIGHWADRVPAIERDLADMEKHGASLASSERPVADAAAIRRAMQVVASPPSRPALACKHVPATHFEPGRPLDVALTFPNGDGRKANLLYRHVDQGERWQRAQMQWRDRQYVATIAAEYTRSPFPLQYYFEVEEAGSIGLYPSFGSELANQPYFLLRQTVVRWPNASPV